MLYIAKAYSLKNELDGLRPIDKEIEAKIMQKFRLDWDYHSNHLEGNSLSYGETKALILFGITAQGKPLKDHFEITGHDEAIKWVTDIVKGERPLTETFIRELHTLLLKESYEVDAITPEGLPTKKRIEVGAYKSTPNHVKTKTGEIFRFAEPEETPALMHDLLDWYEGKIEEKDFSPLLIAAEFHYKFIRVHPFDDGNGRTVRILMNFILMKYGFPPVIIKTEEKARYYSVLQQADAGSIEPFIEYVAENLCHSLEIMIKGAKGESIEEPDDLDKEITLLRERISQYGKKVIVKREEDILKELFDKSFLKLSKMCILQCKKFDEFYYSSKVYYVVVIDGVTHTLQSIEPIKRLINEQCSMLSVIYDYQTFNHADVDEFNYTTELCFSFNLSNYTLKGITSKITKPYGEQLTEAQVSEVMREEMKVHKEFIEKKIRESEQKNGNN